MRRGAPALVALMAVLSFATIPSAPSVRAAEALVLSPPVDAPILDPFRLPDGPYGAGNRGIEYDTVEGESVRAAAGGTVVFAGAVARTLHVTVDHGGGLVSSYSFLARILVSEGDIVTRGQRVGLAGPTFHFGVRVFGEYVDPASLLGSRVVRVRLVAGPESAVATARGGVSTDLPRGLTRSAPARSAAG